MKKMKHKKTAKPERRKLSLWLTLKSSARFVLLFKRTFFFWCLANLSFLLIFRLIPNGWTNSLSILWLVAYYVYWCVFVRHIQNHPPYFSLIRIFNGLIPASKIMFINISIYVGLLILPYIPMVMGMRDRYLEFFEQYMSVLESYNALCGKILFYLFMLLLSPYTLSRPYLAWISSIIGKNRSIIDAYKRTRKNYWAFVACGSFVSAPLLLAYLIDVIYNIDILIYIMTVLPIYFTIVFIDIYKVFYQRAPRVKS